MIKQLQVFGIKLLIALSVVLGIHSIFLYLLGISILQNLLIPSYITNYFLALLIFLILVKLKKKYLDLLGFVFMATAFLTPYLLCLIVETFYLIKLLNYKM